MTLGIRVDFCTLSSLFVRDLFVFLAFPSEDYSDIIIVFVISGVRWEYVYGSDGNVLLLFVML